MASYTIYLLQIYLATCTLFLAGKDASSFLLKTKTDDTFSFGRVKRWHRDGFILFVLTVIPCIVIAGNKWYWIVASAILIRASIFDPCFNSWASLPVNFLGGTAWSDKLFVKLFGQHGATKKSLFFMVLLAVLQYFIYKY